MLLLPGLLLLGLVPLGAIPVCQDPARLAVGVSHEFALPTPDRPGEPAQSWFRLPQVEGDMYAFTIEVRAWDAGEPLLLVKSGDHAIPQEFRGEHGIVRAECMAAREEDPHVGVAGPAGAEFSITCHEGFLPPLPPVAFELHRAQCLLRFARSDAAQQSTKECLTTYAQALLLFYSHEDAAGILDGAPEFVTLAQNFDSKSMCFFGRTLLAWALLRNGQAAEAWEETERAHAALSDLGGTSDPGLMADLERTSAQACLLLDRPADAEACVRRMAAIPGLEHAASGELVPRSWGEIGEHYWEQFRARDARRCFEAGCAAITQDCPAIVEFRIRWRVAITCQEVGDFVAADAILADLEARAAEQPAEERILLHILRADLNRELGREDLALQGFAAAEVLAADSAMPAHAAQARLYRADYLVALGREAEAFPLYRSMEDDAGIHRLFRARSRAGVGLELLAQGRPDLAQAKAESALAAFEEGDPVEWSLPAHAVLVASRLDQGQVAEAGEAMKRAERILDAPAVRQRSEDVAFFLSRYRSLSALAMDLSAARIAGAAEGDAASAILTAWSTVNLWKGRTVLESLDPAEEGGGGWRFSDSSWCRRVPQDTVVLDFAFGRTTVYAFRAWRGEISFHALGDRTAIVHEVRRLVTAMRAPVQGPQDAFLRGAIELHAQLLAPLIPEDAKAALIVPAGDLSRLPFEALVSRLPAGPEPDLRQARFVVEDLQIAYAPSLAAWLRFEDSEVRRPERVAVIADPDFSGGRLPPLPGTLLEAEAILEAAPDSTVLLGADCVKSAVLPLLVESDWIHLGTHSRYDHFLPGRSSIALAGEDSDDLTLEEVLDLPLNAQVTVLSACDTAAGWDLPGDGPQSFAAAFLRAGSRGVVASLWPVRDETTADLMADFSRAALVAGVPPAAALRLAKLRFLEAARSDGARAAEAAVPSVASRGGRAFGAGGAPLRDLTHPHFWAAFTYSGALAGQPAVPPPAVATQQQTVVILKFGPGVQIPYVDHAEQQMSGALEAGWSELAALYPGISLTPTYPFQDPATWDALKARLTTSQMPQIAVMRRFFDVTLPAGADVTAFRGDALQRLPGLQLVTAKARGRNPSVDPSDDVWAKDQTYLQSPDWTGSTSHFGGVGIADLWKDPADGTFEAGSDGDGMRVLVIERDWYEDHADLQLAGRYSLVFGDRENVEESIEHGTGTIGVIAGLDNVEGIVGICPNIDQVLLGTYLTWNPATSEFDQDIDDAIVEGIAHLSAGEAMLLEIQTDGNAIVELNERPIEIYPEVFEAIKLATLLGVVVIEPAGNKAESLDAFWTTLTSYGYSSDDYVDDDCGAILVAACSAVRSTTRGECDPFRAYFASAFGARIHCFAFGADVMTTGISGSAPPWTSAYYSATYNATSAASAIVAGAVCALQGVALQRRGALLTPEEMRALLTDPVNTSSCSNAVTWIGLMPNLPLLVDKIVAGADLFVRDDTTDDGVGMSVSVFDSPDIVIWTKPTAPASVTDLDSPGPALTGSGSASVYIRAHNRGLATSSSGQVQLYWAPAATLLLPSDFNFIGAKALPAILADSKDMSDAFTPVGSVSSFEGCLMTIVSADGDRTADFKHPLLEDAIRFSDFVKRQNNFALRNVVMKTYSGKKVTRAECTFSAAGGPRDSEMDFEIVGAMPAGARIRLIVNEEFLGLLTPDQRKKVREDGSRRILQVPPNGKFSLGALRFPARSRYPMELEVEMPALDQRGPFHLTAQQRWKKRVVGRMDYRFVPVPARLDHAGEPIREEAESNPQD